MFDVTAQLVNNQEEINCLDKNSVREEFLGVCHQLIVKKSSIFNAQKSMYSRILCCVSERFLSIPIPTKLGKKELQESELRRATKIMILSTESRQNSSGTFFRDSKSCSSVRK